MKQGAKKKVAKKKIDDEYVSVKIKRSTYDRLSSYKKESRIPISWFIDSAVEEKFKRIGK